MSRHISSSARQGNLLDQDREAIERSKKPKRPGPAVSRGETIYVTGTSGYRKQLFIAKERFVSNSFSGSKVEGPLIRRIGSTFRERVLSVVEQGVISGGLVSYVVRRPLTDRTLIVGKLQGAYVTKLCHFFRCLEQQPEGKAPEGKKDFLSIKNANTFYILVYEEGREAGTLFAVSAIWNKGSPGVGKGRGWDLRAREVDQAADTTLYSNGDIVCAPESHV